jgi:hypothetical protein
MDALIENGSSMSDYVNLPDAAVGLYGLNLVVDAPDSSINVFNAIGVGLAEPDNAMNVALGGHGSVRRVVKTEGILKVAEKLSTYFHEHQ